MAKLPRMTIGDLAVNLGLRGASLMIQQRDGIFTVWIWPHNDPLGLVQRTDRDLQDAVMSCLVAVPLPDDEDDDDEDEDDDEEGAHR